MKKLCILFFLSTLIFAQPKPGDVFREHMWFYKEGDAGQAIRVGGNNNETYSDRSIVGKYWITKYHEPNWNTDLQNAVKAELVLEKILSHDRTTGLAIQINDSSWIKIPKADSIPNPQEVYYHHYYPRVNIPLSHLKEGKENTIRFRVNKSHTWNWPQHLINGAHLLVYYDSSKISHPKCKFISPLKGDTLGSVVKLQVEVESPNSSFATVRYIGKYDDINWEGDGVYNQWHYHYYHGAFTHNIGERFIKPYLFNWSTEWVPDQKNPISLAAMVKDNTGLVYFSESIDSLILDRDFSVELCKPYQIPQGWVTRNSQYQEKVKIKGDISKAVEYRLCWTSWSPGYMNGLYVNSSKVFSSEGPHYQYYAHQKTYSDVSVLQQGENIIRTEKTPLINNQMVHGAEIQYPGIMMLVKYQDITSAEEGEIIPTEFRLENYPNPFNPSSNIVYSIAEPQNVNITVYDVTGQKVIEVVNEFRLPGVYEVIWNGKNEYGNKMSTGIYMARLKSAGINTTIKMLMLK